MSNINPANFIEFKVKVLKSIGFSDYQLLKETVDYYNELLERHNFILMGNKK
jgi:hypothetical protein